MDTVPLLCLEGKTYEFLTHSLNLTDCIEAQWSPLLNGENFLDYLFENF